MNYQDLQLEKNELLSVEDEKIREMCGNLKRVSAPKDFDFRLKARFANVESQTSKSPIFAFLRYAAPLGLVVMLLGMIVLNNLFSVDNTAVPQITGNFIEKPIVKNDVLVQTETFSETSVRNSGPNADITNVTPKNENSNSNKSLLFSMKDKDELAKVLEKDNRISESNGSSRDEASRQPRVFTPQMSNSNKSVESANSLTNSKPFYVKEILAFFGISASFTGNSWKVQSVKPDSLADRSGIKPNDLIEAIENNRISTETIQTDSINGNKITIVRDGKRFEIVLK